MNVTIPSPLFALLKLRLYSDVSKMIHCIEVPAVIRCSLCLKCPRGREERFAKILNFESFSQVLKLRYVPYWTLEGTFQGPSDFKM